MNSAFLTSILRSMIGSQLSQWDSPTMRNWESWGCSAYSRGGSEGSHQCPQIPAGKCKRTETGSVQWCPGITWSPGALPAHQAALLCWELLVCWHVGCIKAAWMWAGVPLLGQGWSTGTQRFLQASAILWLCGSAIFMSYVYSLHHFFSICCSLTAFTRWILATDLLRDI